MGHYRVKSSLYNVQQVWWSLHWVLYPAGQAVCESWGLAAYWSFSAEAAPLSNHCAQSPASVQVISPGHAMGHCKIKCSLYVLHQIGWSLHWVLRQGTGQLV